MHKICRDCAEKKPLCDFGKSSQNKDKLMTRCRECYMIRVHAYRATEIGRKSARGTVKRYHKSPKGRAAKRKYEMTDKGRTRRVKNACSHKARNIEKVSARSKVRYAVNIGKMTRDPCVICLSPEKAHGHHEDYARPLDVVWLCKDHHNRRHLIRTGGDIASFVKAELQMLIGE